MAFDWSKNPKMARNVRKIWDQPDAVQELDPDHFTVYSLRTPSRRVPVYRRGDIWRCRSDRVNTQDRPCSHILAVLLYRGDESWPNTSQEVWKKTGEPRNHALEEQVFRDLEEGFSQIAAKLLRQAEPIISSHLPDSGRGRPRKNPGSLVYQGLQRVLHRVNLRRLQGAMEAASHREHNPYGSAGRSTQSRFLADDRVAECLDQLIAVTTVPAAPYEYILHADGTGLTEDHFNSFFDEKHGKEDKPRRHVWHFFMPIWTYNHNLIAALHVQKGPFGENPWLLPLVERARLTLDVREIGGDKAYDSNRSFRYAANNGIDAQFKIKDNATARYSSWVNKDRKSKITEKATDPQGYAAKANRRNNAESCNHAFKALFGDEIYSRNTQAQLNEIRLMALAWNLYRLLHVARKHDITLDFTAGVQKVTATPWKTMDKLHREFQTWK